MRDIFKFRFSKNWEFLVLVLILFVGGMMSRGSNGDVIGTLEKFQMENSKYLNFAKIIVFWTYLYNR